MCGSLVYVLFKFLSYEKEITEIDCLVIIYGHE